MGTIRKSTRPHQSPIPTSVPRAIWAVLSLPCMKLTVIDFTGFVLIFNFAAHSGLITQFVAPVSTMKVLYLAAVRAASREKTPLLLPLLLHHQSVPRAVIQPLGTCCFVPSGSAFGGGFLHKSSTSAVGSADCCSPWIPLRTWMLLDVESLLGFGRAYFSAGFSPLMSFLPLFSLQDFSLGFLCSTKGFLQSPFLFPWFHSALGPPLH